MVGGIHNKDQPTGVTSTSLLKRGRPKGSKDSNLSCAYCDEPNSPANVICVGCEHPLKCKRGRPTENPDVPVINPIVMQVLPVLGVISV